MPPPRRPRIEPTEDWQQLALLVKEPAQRTYELIRPVVLFGRSPPGKQLNASGPRIEGEVTLPEVR